MQNEKRQLGGISPLLDVISQVLPQHSDVGSALPDASTLPGASTGITAQASCDKAVQKINDAIQLSAALTSKNGGKASTQDVLIVLAVLQASLGESCNIAKSPNTGGIASSSGPPGAKRDVAFENTASEGILGDITGSGRDDDTDDARECAELDDSDCADAYPDEASRSQGSTRTDILQVRHTTLSSSCTACEAELYSIIKQLQILFISSGTIAISFSSQPRLNAAVQRLRMETSRTGINEKRCDETKC